MKLSASLARPHRVTLCLSRTLTRLCKMTQNCAPDRFAIVAEQLRELRTILLSRLAIYFDMKQSVMVDKIHAFCVELDLLRNLALMHDGHALFRVYRASERRDGPDTKTSRLIIKRDIRETAETVAELRATVKRAWLQIAMAIETLETEMRANGEI
jgi:hypothetical protein